MSWPDAAVDYVQAIADTKLLLSHRYSQWMLSGPALEDGIAGASAAQDELGHVRQLFRLLGGQGREDDWLEGDRGPDEYASAAPLDSRPEDWTAFVATVGPVERAAWYMIDAIDHEEFDGLATRIGQDEFFHLEFLDGRLETIAEEDPEATRAALERSLPGTLAFVGPAAYDEETDPLYGDYTDRSVAALRVAFRRKYEEILSATPVSPGDLDVDWDAPAVEAWDESRRRVGDGAISEEDATSLSGVRNEEFAMD
jgi:ring-1,2-phenylacetyl-CoA epoxidase subunit PaaC